jgi:hypothetical protein
MRLTAIAALLVLFVAATTPVPGEPLLLSDPYQIYARTREAWTSQRYPDYVSYTIIVQVDERGVQKIQHYHLVDETHSDNVHVNPVSDEEQQKPADGRGYSIHLQPKRQFIPIMDKRVGHPAEAVDYLGIPKLSPTYSFGLGIPMQQPGSGDDLVAQIRREFNDPMPAKKAQQIAQRGPLRSIASVTAIARNYSIRLAGIEPLEQSSCYHLLLQPVHDPKRFRLRELWIDTANYETRKLLTAGNFTDSPVSWTVTFADVNGAHYIASEVAQAPVGVGDHLYERASITFADIAAADPPAQPFDSFVTNEKVMTEPPF